MMSPAGSRSTTLTGSSSTRPPAPTWPAAAADLCRSEPEVGRGDCAQSRDDPLHEFHERHRSCRRRGAGTDLRPLQDLATGRVGEDREAGDLSIPARRLASSPTRRRTKRRTSRCWSTSLGATGSGRSMPTMLPGRTTIASRRSCCRSASAFAGSGPASGCPAGSSPCHSVRVPKCSPGCAHAARWRCRGVERQHRLNRSSACTAAGLWPDETGA